VKTKKKLETNVKMTRIAILVETDMVNELRRRTVTTGVPAAFQIRQMIKKHLAESK
jgi:hypothetical protein